MAIESQPKFSSSSEELEWLRQQFKEKIEAKEAKEAEEKKEIIRQIFGEHISKSSEKISVPEDKTAEKEIRAAVLQLKPETHDAQMEELLGILEEKGIVSAVSVARGLGPHIEDDFHRVLVQYFLDRIEKPGFSPEKSRLFKAVGMVLYEISFPQEEQKILQNHFKDTLKKHQKTKIFQEFYARLGLIKNLNLK